MTTSVITSSQKTSRFVWSVNFCEIQLNSAL